MRQSFIVVWFYECRNHTINILAKDSNDLISMLRWDFCHSPLQEQTINLFDPFGFQNWQAESLITVVAYSRYQSSSQSLGSPSSLDHVSARGVLQTGKAREVPLHFCSTEGVCGIGQGSREIRTQTFSFFSDFLKNLLNHTKLSHLAPVALAIMTFGKLVSDTLPRDADVIYIVEILIWEANMCFKVPKYRICDVLLSCRTIEKRFR